jgi:hypothetical protein
MSSNGPQRLVIPDEPEEHHPAEAAPEDEMEETPSGRREFSWYGGQVDENLVREIVRLKREQKL